METCVNVQPVHHLGVDKWTEFWLPELLLLRKRTTLTWQDKLSKWDNPFLLEMLEMLLPFNNPLILVISYLVLVINFFMKPCYTALIYFNVLYYTLN